MLEQLQPARQAPRPRPAGVGEVVLYPVPQPDPVEHGAQAAALRVDTWRHSETAADRVGRLLPTQ